MKILFEKFVEKFVFDHEYICCYEKKPCIREITIVTSKKSFNPDFELLRLNKLYEDHINFSCYGKFELIKYISIKENYSNRFVLTSEKK